MSTVDLEEALIEIPLETVCPADDVAFKTLFTPDGSFDLEAITETIADAPEIDEAKVQYFRDKIAKGEYAIDSERIADLLQEIEK